VEARLALSSATDGDGKIQKNFAARPRLISAIVAVATTVSIAAVLTAPGFSSTATLAWILVGLVLLGSRQAPRRLLGAAISALGLLAVIEVLQGSFLALAAPLLGGALLAAAEFGHWSIELQLTVSQSATTLRRRTSVVVSLVVVGVGGSALLALVLGMVATQASWSDAAVAFNRLL
jgi:hypothetical protein